MSNTIEPIVSEEAFTLPRLIALLGRKPNVLCVEDNLMNAELVRSFLNGYCLIDHTSTARETYDRIQTLKYDLILMDINLGNEINGIDLSTEIRKYQGYYHTPIAAVTGFIAARDQEAVFSGGLDYYLSKPFKREELQSLIQEILIRLIFTPPDTSPTVPINAP